MVHKLYKVSAPGSLMLFGEHAVLTGKPAIVCAINKRLHVKLQANNSSKITITDSKLGTISQELTELHIQQPFSFVLSALMLFKDKIKTGFDLEIAAEFDSTVGFGSSAAVTAATVAVLSSYLENINLDNENLFYLAKQAIISVQGVGSGADLAASIYGGVLGFQLRPLTFIPLPIIPDLTAVYCGYKKATKEVVALVNAAAAQQPAEYARIFDAIEDCVTKAKAAIKQQDWQLLGQLFDQHHSLQCALGTNNALLDTLIRQLRNFPQIAGAKISGSGLGDCVIGLGNLAKVEFPMDASQRQQGVMQIPVTIDQAGVIYEHD
jgi:mevalonate kinase